MRDMGHFTSLWATSTNTHHTFVGTGHRLQPIVEAEPREGELLCLLIVVAVVRLLGEVAEVGGRPASAVCGTGCVHACFGLLCSECSYGEVGGWVPGLRGGCSLGFDWKTRKSP